MNTSLIDLILFVGIRTVYTGSCSARYCSIVIRIHCVLKCSDAAAVSASIKRRIVFAVVDKRDRVDIQ